MSGGYVKIHRQLEESNVFENPLTFKVFMWCLMRANYTTRDIRLHGENVTLRPGQFISGRFAGARACHMKPSTFRNQINALLFMGTIALKSDNKKTIFTVLNWARFQCEASEQDNGRTTKGHRQEGKKERKKRGVQYATHGEQGDEQKQPSEVQSFITFFCQKHEEHRKSKYAVQPGRDHKAAKEMLLPLGLEECQARAVRYLIREDKWNLEHGYTIHNLGVVINGLSGCNAHETGFQASQREARELQRIREQQGVLCRT
jgi:hypothetical protein